jgi:hypothetical protein
MSIEQGWLCGSFCQTNSATFQSRGRETKLFIWQGRLAETPGRFGEATSDGRRAVPAKIRFAPAATKPKKMKNAQQISKKM